MSFSDSDSMLVTELYDEQSFEQSQQKLTQEVQGFDYAVLSPQVRIVVQGKTSELKSLMRKTAQDIIDIGQKLIEVKEQLGHGNFRAWLKAEFDWSVRTAGRFMQVATQFKCANLAHLNIAVSALYLLAEPSTPEKARKETLELVKEGENITHTKAKAIVNRHQKLAQPNALKPAIIDISAKAEEGNSFTLSQPNQSPQIHSQLEPKNEANSAAIELSIETVPTIGWEQRLEYKAIEKSDWVPKEYSEVATQLQPKLCNHIRVLNIENQNSELVTNTTQTFDLTFAGIRVDFEGDPEVLIILFKQMQKNPAFTEEVLQYAKFLAAGVK
ncbi:MAG: DUF3102 domain-containing protein [Nostoc sp. DedQUE05]|uniref:DUF3102 domain-containing protein n=1 Tax=Nostoc sp. DedQUE05 TaxID=3075391 RepID=UPI002AD4EDE7|nr:DUF3102 domain-containing protein [Nostoc sp. DedQUE05]MDZ8091523.1 DUF3102 domain-containing protein [Nostoc sp. DedQUE05]